MVSRVDKSNLTWDKHSKDSVNKQLKKKATLLFERYFCVFPTEGSQGLHYLMQMGEYDTPSESEALEALRSLSALEYALDGEGTRADEIPSKIMGIVNKLIEKNPKNRLIFQATQIEIAINLEKPGALIELKEPIEKLYQVVTHEMPNIQAEVLCGILREVPSSEVKGLADRISQILD